MIIDGIGGAAETRDVDGGRLHGKRHESGRSAKSVLTGKALCETGKVDVPRGVDGFGVLFPELVHLFGIVGVGGVDKGVGTGGSIGFGRSRTSLLRLGRRLVGSERSVQSASIWKTRRDRGESGGAPSGTGDGARRDASQHFCFVPFGVVAERVEC